jgi:hypothetical protein
MVMKGFLFDKGSQHGEIRSEMSGEHASKAGVRFLLGKDEDQEDVLLNGLEDVVYFGGSVVEFCRVSTG